VIDLTSTGRRSSLIAVAALLTLLAGCGQEPQDAVVITAADRSAVVTCAHVVPAVDHALGAVLEAEDGSTGKAEAQRSLSGINESLQDAADGVSDDLVQQAVQDMVDSVAVYLAVLPDRSVGAYDDAVADVKGRLGGFRRTCPVDNADFDAGAKGWAATSEVSGITQASIGRHGPGLDLKNLGEDPSDIGIADAPGWVDRTWPGAYRAGLWARSQSGSPTLTLRLQEQSGGNVVGEVRTSIRLGPDWAFVGVTYDATGLGGPLDLAVTAEDVPAAGGVLIDDFAVARG